MSFDDEDTLHLLPDYKEKEDNNCINYFQKCLSHIIV